MSHPLAEVVRRAVLLGDFPASDGRAEVLPPWRDGVEGVIAFSGHAYACLGGPDPQGRLDDALSATGTYEPGFGGLSDPRVVVELAGGSQIDSLDSVLVAPGTAPGEHALVPRAGSHPRIDLARSLRDDVTAWTTEQVGVDGLLTTARGLAGLVEVSVEVRPSTRGRGLGAVLARAARSAASPDDVVIAAVAPGNAVSQRTFWSAGYRPVASLQLWWT